MRARLREAVAEAKRKGEDLLGLLEEQLGLARQEAAWRTLHKDALQAEEHKISVQLQAQTTEAKDTMEKRMLCEKLKRKC